MQIVRIGGIAPQAKCLAAPWRRTLPWHPFMQGRVVGGSVMRRDLQRHLDEPAVDRRKRQLFGINDARSTRAQWISGPLSVCGCACRRRTGQDDRRGKNRLHGHSRRISGVESAVTPKARLRAVHGKIKLRDAYKNWKNQFRLRVASPRRRKPATTVTTMTIQYWKSKPRTEKCSTRKCNAPAPPFSGQNNYFKYFA